MDLKTFYFIKNKENQKFDTFNYAIKKNKDLILDKIGIIQFLKFCYPLYNRTFLENIKFDSCYKNDEKLDFTYYEKRIGYSDKNEKLLWEILNNSLSNICFDKKKIFGVGNSGGLDSRIILYILKKLNIKISSYTFGNEKSDAVYIANKTAKILNINNKVIEIEEDFLIKYWNIIIEKKPMHSLLFSWYYSALKDLPHFDINITGFNGDNMLGSHLSNELIKIKSKNELYRYIFEYYSMVPDNLLKKIINDKTLVEKSYIDYLKNIKKSSNSKNENIFEEFNFKSRQLKFIINAINFDYCNNHKWDSPFCSKEFINFALNLTFKERYQRKLYYNTAKKYMKELNKIRFERNFLSLNDDNEFKILLKKILWNLDKKLNFHFYYKGSHKNIPNWLENSNSILFIRDVLKVPSKPFNEIFKTKFILKNLKLIYKTNIYLIFNLLTIKLWIDNNIQY